jgi:hypothetical protein
MDTPTPEQLTAVRLFVLQRAIAALIMTHPDPEKFAQAFGAAAGMAQIDHLTAPKATEALRAEAGNFARELLVLAQDEASHRLAQKGE